MAPLPPEPPALVADEEPELSAALLALPETVCRLQSQVAALQQQVTDLTRLLTQHAARASHPGGSRSAEQEEPAITQVSTSCSALASCGLCQSHNDPQAGACHPSR